MGDGNEEFSPVNSQGIDLSQDDVHASRPSCASEGRTGSSGSKRKRGSQRKVDVEGIHLALNQTNEQLMMIAEWPTCALANDNHVRMEFFCILREMLELMVWIGRYCKGIFCLVWTTFGTTIFFLHNVYLKLRKIVTISPKRYNSQSQKEKGLLEIITTLPLVSQPLPLCDIRPSSSSTLKLFPCGSNIYFQSIPLTYDLKDKNHYVSKVKRQYEN
uniref:Retrotransposon protein n=1 Tax=Cucumis melo TaxID=3656 RepID=A0A9I9EBG1_CUCME